MPILARGKYSVRVFGPGKDPFISGKAASFDYFPYNLALLPFFGIFVIAGFVVWNLIDRDYSAARNLVLLPAAAAVFWGALSEPTWGIVVSAPLIALAGVFIILRVTRVRGWGAAAALSILGASLGAGLSVIFEIGNLGIGLTIALAIPVTFLGILIGLPYAVTRVAVRDDAGNGRAWAGMAPAVPLALFTFLVALLVTEAEAPLHSLLVALVLFIFPAVLFALLVRWNAWARDVATGAMFEPRGAPYTADGDSAGPRDGDAPPPTEEDSSNPPDGLSPVSPA